MFLSLNKKCKIDKCLNNSACLEGVFDNLVITCEEEMVNSAPNSFNEKVTNKMNWYFYCHCFVSSYFILFYFTLFYFILFLLIIIRISCY